MDGIRVGQDKDTIVIERAPDPSEIVDDGPVIASEDVPIRPDDDLAAFEARIHAVEHRLLVDTLRSLCSKPPVPISTPGAS